MKIGCIRGVACWFCVLAVFSGPLFAFGNLSAAEVRALFSGQTVDGEFREGSKKHIDPSGVNTFSEPFVMYFSADGTVRSIRGGVKKTGKWRVDAKGNHCVQWSGKKEVSTAEICLTNSFSQPVISIIKPDSHMVLL